MAVTLIRFPRQPAAGNSAEERRSALTVDREQPRALWGRARAGRTSASAVCKLLVRFDSLPEAEKVSLTRFP